MRSRSAWMLEIVWLIGLCWPSLTLAQSDARPAPGVSTARTAQFQERSVQAWLMRLHEAAQRYTYAGTFVVSRANAGLASAHIWHVCNGPQQLERIESLTGAPRITFRKDQQVLSLDPLARIALLQRKESLGPFPHVLKSTQQHDVEGYYSARVRGVQRIAGLTTDVLNLIPADKLRFGYRIWSEQRTGLALKVQTLDTQGQVLEESAFTHLQWQAPTTAEQLLQMMTQTPLGYRIEQPKLVATTAKAEGWHLRRSVPGFKPIACVKRWGKDSATEPTLQWIFSDGLASVSLFIQSFDSQHHRHEGVHSQGATYALSFRISQQTGNLPDRWVTVIGEVPPQTLHAFAKALEHKDQP